MDETEEEEGLKRYREARANEMFPDEVDTPIDVAAKIRCVLNFTPVHKSFARAFGVCSSNTGIIYCTSIYIKSSKKNDVKSIVQRKLYK